MNNPPDREVRIVRTFDISVEKAWRAWTDEKIMAKWFGPKDFTTPVCQVDAHVGGKLYLEMEDSDENRYPMDALFEAVDPPNRLVFTTGAVQNDAGEPELTTRNTVTLEDVGGKTKTTLHILVTKADSPEALQALSGMEMGWSMSFDKFADIVK